MNIPGVIEWTVSNWSKQLKVSRLFSPYVSRGGKKWRGCAEKGVCVCVCMCVYLSTLYCKKLLILKRCVHFTVLKVLYTSILSNFVLLLIIVYYYLLLNTHT